jgi:ABC-2 type transport system ATP-binding protein
MTCREYLEFFAAAYFIEAKRRSLLIKDLLELVDLSNKQETYIEELSRGMTQRLALARTLIHDPRLLILDEPASGLDPRARVELRELLKELSRMGKTIIISSHILTELTEMCSHVGIIERGVLLASGRVSDILGKLNGQLKVIKLRMKPVKPDKTSLLQEILLSGPGVKTARPLEAENQGPTSSEWELQVEGSEAELNRLLRYYIEKNIPLYSFSEQPTNLEEIFLQVTQGYVS